MCSGFRGQVTGSFQQRHTHTPVRTPGFSEGVSVSAGTCGFCTWNWWSLMVPSPQACGPLNGGLDGGSFFNSAGRARLVLEVLRSHRFPCGPCPGPVGASCQDVAPMVLSSEDRHHLTSDCGPASLSLRELSRWPPSYSPRHPHSPPTAPQRGLLRMCFFCSRTVPSQSL